MDTATILWVISTIVVIAMFFWWFIRRLHDVEEGEETISDAPSRQIQRDSMIKSNAGSGPNVKAALRRSRNKYHDDFDDDFDGEDALDAIDTVMEVGRLIREERNPEFPNVARDGLESEMAPTYDSPKGEALHRSESVRPAPEPAQEPARESYSSGSDSGGSSSYDSGSSGSSDSGGGDD